MSRKSLLLSLLAGLGVAVILTTAGLVWFFGSGSIQVQVAGRDTPTLHFNLPFALVHAGLLMAPDDVFARGSAEFEVGADAWQSALLAACEGLARCPDGEFVRVESGSDRVVVVKERSQLRILVESDGEELRVALPIKSLGKIGRILARRA